MRSIFCLYCNLRTDFSHFSGVFIVDFEQVNASWKCALLSLITTLLSNMSQLTLRQASRMSFIWLSFAALNVWIWEIPICVWCLYGYNLIDRYISIFSLGQTKQQSLRNFGSTLENCLVPVTRPDNFCSVKRLKDVNASTSFVRYRTISGICNNLTPGKATVGAAGTITGRFFERKWSTFYLVVASIYSIDI